MKKKMEIIMEMVKIKKMERVGKKNELVLPRGFTTKMEKNGKKKTNKNQGFQD